MKSKPITYVVAGIVIAVVAIVLFFTYYFTGLSYESNFLSYIPPLVTIALLVFFIISYGRAMDHNVTFGSLFGYGFRTTIIYVLIMTFFLVAVNYLMPAYKEKFIEHFTSEMDKTGNVQEEQKEMVISTTSKYFSLLMVGGALFMNMITGTVGAVIGAFFSKKNPQTPFDTQP